jgi:predicted Ser/Thr protein kinase
MQCPACHAPLDEQMKFCPLCATPVAPTSGSFAIDPVRQLLERALGGQFELVRVLGRGGMGVVYLARERGLDRLVAIKVLSPEVSATPESRERFRREARTAAKLTHPNIMPLYAFGEVNDLAYLVMGYVRGESLATRLEQEARLSVETTRRIMVELADALDYAHRHGVIHRDIKPDNVLIDDESGHAILTDFGIAKARAEGDSLTESGAVLGTPQYMSPEQATGEREIDGRTDIYSLGILGYRCVCGRLPYEGRSYREVLLRQMTQEPPPLETLRPDVPADLAAAIIHCLVAQPEGRWPDGKSLRLALAGEDLPDVALPGDLRDIPSFGTWAALWALVWGMAAAGEYAQEGDPTLLALVALLVPVGFLLHAWNIGRKGFRPLHILRVGFWPPKWWGMWWPRALRRPDDVWDCLPRSAKLTRVALTAFFILAPVLTYVAKWTTAVPALSAHRPTFRVAFRVAELVIITLTGAIVAASIWLWRRQGIAGGDIPRLLLGSTVGAMFWGRPQIVAVLRARASDRESCSVQLDTPHDCLRGLSEAAELLGGPARALGSSALSAGRQLLASIEARDAEIVTLAREADPAEISRLERKLAALGDSPTDADEQQMRMLLRSQLELVRRLGARLDAATSHRAHLVDMLKTLCLQVMELRARRAEDNLERGEIMARIRRLCAAVEQQAEREVRRPKPAAGDSRVNESSVVSGESVVPP